MFIFQAGSTLIAEANSNVLLINGADPCRVVWQVGSSATFKTGTEFVGDVLAQTSITAQTEATFRGRLLARDGAVTLDTNTISNSTCAAPAGGSSPTTGVTTTTTTARAGATTTIPGTDGSSTTPAALPARGPGAVTPAPSTPPSGAPGTPTGGSGGPPRIPATGMPLAALTALGIALFAAGVALTTHARTGPSPSPTSSKR